MTRLALLSVLLVSACSEPRGDGNLDAATAAADSDGDGMSDADEAIFGSDPASADTDGDGLLDGEEALAGTDPLASDTDEDGYSDFDELETGHSPTDDSDRIYAGGWPYNPDKDTLENPGWEGNAAEGGMLPDFQSYDQYGDEFDIYDYAGHDKPIIIDVSAGWCYYCQEMSKLLAGQRSYFDDFASSYDGIAQIKEMVDNGDVLWVEVLDQTDAYEEVNQDFLEAWDGAFPNENVAVVADERQRFARWLPIAGYPTILAVNSSMVIKSFDPGDYISPLNWAVSHAD